MELTSSIHLQTLSQITKEQASTLITARNGFFYFEESIEEASIIIDYPMKKPKELIIKDVSTFGELAWLISKEYASIYKKEEAVPGTYGIWGHSFGDLYLEIVSISKSGKIEIFIGS